MPDWIVEFTKKRGTGKLAPVRFMADTKQEAQQVLWKCYKANRRELVCTLKRMRNPESVGDESGSWWGVEDVMK